MSDRLKTRIEVGGVDIAFFNKVILENVYVEDRHRDTLVKAGAIKAYISMLDLDSGIVKISRTALENAHIKIAKYPNEKGLNFQFIIDEFASDQPKDSTKKPFKLICRNFQLKNSKFNYSDFRKKHGVEGVIDWDYIALDDLNGRISDLEVFDDSTSLVLDNLSFIEKSGFKVNKISSVAVVKEHEVQLNQLTLKTPYSYVQDKIHLHYNSFSDIEDDFINKVKMNVHLRESNLNLFDISYFSEELKGINKEVKIVNADLDGYVSDFTGRNMKIAFGDMTHINGKIRMTGLPDINNTIIDLRIKELVTSKKDIEGIPLPPFTKGEYIELPDEINQLGKITYVGDFTGFYNDFVTYGKFTSSLGNANTDIKINYNLETEVTSYSGKLITENFNIGKLIRFEENVGKVSMNGTIKGHGFTINEAHTELDGHISSLELNDYNYQNINVKGTLSKKVFNGHLDIDDENIAFKFDGAVDYNGKIPKTNFTAEVVKANLTDLKLLKMEEFSGFTGNFNIKMEGNNLDDARGVIEIGKLIGKIDNRAYNLGDITLNKTIDVSGNKTLVIDSKFLEVDINGDYKLTEIPNSFKNLIHYYLNSVFDDEKTSGFNTPENFKYTIKIKDSDYITSIFMPELSIPKTGLIEGDYDVKKHVFSLKSSFPDVTYNGIHLKDFSINALSDSTQFNIQTNCKKVSLTDSMYAENFKVNLAGRNNNINYSIDWKNNESIENSGDIKGNAIFNAGNEVDLILASSEIVLHDTVWTIRENGKISFDSLITINNIQITHAGQSIAVNGKISRDTKDKLVADIKDFNLAHLNLLLKDEGFEIKGVTTGSFNLANLYEHAILSAAMNFTELTLNNELIGTGNVISNYDSRNEFVNLQGSFIKNNYPTIKFDGAYHPYRKNNNLNFAIKLDKTPLQVISIFTSGILSEIKGNVTGDLSLTGNFEKPVLTGTVMAQKSGFKVDYLNTSYTFSTPINFYENSIEVKDAILFDEFGNKAITDFKLMHRGFKDFKFDILVDAKKLFCLNTTASMNDMFYGKAYATGLIKIGGTPDNITIGIAAKTEKGSKFFIPLSTPEEISESNIVRFVSHDTTKIVQQKKIDLSGIQMNFDLEITPDAETQIIFDQKVGDVIKGRGVGNIKMEINTLGQFNMYGDFVITQGDYLFTLKNVINKRFKVEPGGTIRWNGDPYEALININAIYSVKTSLSPIIGDTTSTGKRSVPVDCKLKLTDRLFNPTVNFEINLTSTTIDQTKKDEFNSLLRPDNVQEINRQVFSLLMLGQFLPLQGQNNNAARLDVAGGAGANSMELLTNQLNNWLAGISKSYDLSVKYRPGTDVTSTQMEMAVSTQLLNDKLSIDGSFGVNQNPTGTTQNTNNIVGDVKVEYKLTNDGKLRLKAYNQTNDYSQVVNTAPYTQGVGIFYREEFSSLGELFRRYGNAFKRKKKTAPVDNALPPVSADSTKVK